MHQKTRLHSDFHYDYEAICEGIDGHNTNCMGFHATFLGLIALWEAIVCPKDLHLEWHSWDCVFGKCQDCGVDNLTFCLVIEEGTSNALVHWKHFSMETIVTKKGDKKKKLKLMDKFTNSKEFIWYLKPKLQYFVCHNFVVRW